MKYESDVKGPIAFFTIQGALLVLVGNKPKPVTFFIHPLSPSGINIVLCAASFKLIITNQRDSIYGVLGTFLSSLQVPIIRPFLRDGLQSFSIPRKFYLAENNREMLIRACTQYIEIQNRTPRNMKDLHPFIGRMTI